MDITVAYCKDMIQSFTCDTDSWDFIRPVESSWVSAAELIKIQALLLQMMIT